MKTLRAAFILITCILSFTPSVFAQKDLPLDDASTAAFVELCKNPDDEQGRSFCFGFGEGVGEGFAGRVFIGLGVGEGAWVTVNTTGIWAAASVPLGSVKLTVPTYEPAGRLVILINQEPDELRVIDCTPGFIIVEAGW